MHFSNYLLPRQFYLKKLERLPSKCRPKEKKKDIRCLFGEGSQENNVINLAEERKREREG